MIATSSTSGRGKEERRLPFGDVVVDGSKFGRQGGKKSSFGDNVVDRGIDKGEERG